MQHFQVKFSKKEGKPFRENSDGSVTVFGYASTNDLDSYRDIVETQVWNKAETLDRYNKNPIVLFRHDMNAEIGKTESLEVTDKGLYIKARIMHNEDDVIEKIKSGTVGAFSIGFMVSEFKYVDKNGVDLLVWKEGETNILKDSWQEEVDKRIITGLELYEISVVGVPANGSAIFTLQKSLTKFLDGMKEDGESPSDPQGLEAKLEILTAKINSMEKLLQKDAEAVETVETTEQVEETVEVVEEGAEEVVEETETTEEVEEVEEATEEVVEEQQTAESTEEVEEEKAVESLEFKALEKSLQEKDAELSELKEYSELLEKRVKQLEEQIEKTPVQKGVMFTAEGKTENPIMKAFQTAKSGETVTL